MPKVWRGLTGTFRERRKLRELPLPATSEWYLLWAPAGFGGTVTRAREMQLIIREYDKNAIVWYPLHPETVGNRTYMKAVFAGYMFVHCKWQPEIDDALKEHAPCPVKFVPDEDTLQPRKVQDIHIEEVKNVVREMEAHPERFTEIGMLQRGENVKINKKQFLGAVGVFHSFLGKNRAIVEVPMFHRNVPVVFHLRDLKPV